MVNQGRQIVPSSSDTKLWSPFASGAFSVSYYSAITSFPSFSPFPYRAIRLFGFPSLLLTFKHSSWKSHGIVLSLWLSFKRFIPILPYLRTIATCVSLQLSLTPICLSIVPSLWGCGAIFSSCLPQHYNLAYFDRSLFFLMCFNPRKELVEIMALMST